MRTIEAAGRKFKVENVPLPKRGRGRPPIFKFVIEQMKIGESVWFATPKEAWALQRAAYKLNIPVSQFKEGKGIRVYRRAAPEICKRIVDMGQLAANLSA